jgi:hypothetical protein
MMLVFHTIKEENAGIDLRDNKLLGKIRKTKFLLRIHA